MVSSRKDGVKRRRWWSSMEVEKEKMMEEQNRRRRGERHSRRRRRWWFSWETKERERREISSREKIASLKALFSSPDKRDKIGTERLLPQLPPTFVEFMIPCLILHIYIYICYEVLLNRKFYSEEENIDILNSFNLKRLAMAMKNICTVFCCSILLYYCSILLYYFIIVFK